MRMLFFNKEFFDVWYLISDHSFPSIVFISPQNSLEAKKIGIVILETVLQQPGGKVHFPIFIRNTHQNKVC